MPGHEGAAIPQEYYLPVVPILLVPVVLTAEDDFENEHGDLDPSGDLVNDREPVLAIVSMHIAVIS